MLQLALGSSTPWSSGTGKCKHCLSLTFKTKKEERELGSCDFPISQSEGNKSSPMWGEGEHKLSPFITEMAPPPTCTYPQIDFSF